MIFFSPILSKTYFCHSPGKSRNLSAVYLDIAVWMHIHISDTIMTDVREERFLQQLDEKNYGSESNFLSLGMQIQKCSMHLYYYLLIYYSYDNVF